LDVYAFLSDAFNRDVDLQSRLGFVHHPELPFVSSPVARRLFFATLLTTPTTG
jgi:hypothetical protein